MKSQRAARTIRVYNADYQPLGFLNFKKAVRLLVIGKAVVHESDPTRERLREYSGDKREWEYPLAIRLVAYVKLNYKKLYGPPIFSKHNVLRRDRYVCAYCGKKATTIDHILPKSRGGANNYMNTVACCYPCNGKKDSKTPEEAGMKLLYAKPHIPTKQWLQEYST